MRWEEAGNYAKAVESYENVMAIDDTFAELHYRMGRCLWALDQFGKARQSFVRARELETLRYRADDGINSAIREAARSMQSSGVYLADVEGAIAESEYSPHRTAGKELALRMISMILMNRYKLIK